VSRVAGQIDDATRRVPKVMAGSLARCATKSRRDLAATRMGRGLLHAWRCWTRLPYPDTVFTYPPCQSCNSPTARPWQIF